MKPEHDPPLSFTVDVENLFFVVGVDKKSQACAVDTERRLDHIWDVLAVLRLVEILEILTAEELVLAQIEVGPVGETIELFPTQGAGKVVFEVDRAARVVREFAGVVLADTDELVAYPNVVQ